MSAPELEPASTASTPPPQTSARKPDGDKVLYSPKQAAQLDKQLAQALAEARSKMTLKAMVYQRAETLEELLKSGLTYEALAKLFSDELNTLIRSETLRRHLSTWRSELKQPTSTRDATAAPSRTKPVQPPAGMAPVPAAKTVQAPTTPTVVGSSQPQSVPQTKPAVAPDAEVSQPRPQVQAQAQPQPQPQPQRQPQPQPRPSQASVPLSAATSASVPNGQQ